MTVIEKGIPMPTRWRGSVTDSLRQLATASVGESILIPAGAIRASSLGNLAKVAAGSVGWYASSTQEDGSIRVWKKSEPKKAQVRK